MAREEHHVRVTESRRKLDSTQWAFMVFAAVMLAWSLLVTLLLILLATRYLFTVIDKDRAAYAVSGAAAFAKAEATRALLAAYEARDAVGTAFRAGLLQGSWDAAALEQVLAPTFSGAPFVRSVELVFPDSDAVISVGQAPPTGDGRVRIGVQSNKDDCFLLGVQGCLVLGDDPSTWTHKVYSLAPAWAPKSPTVDAADWSSEPALVRAMAQGRDQAVTWFPSYRLLFRLADPSGGEDFLAGRVSLDVGALSGERLQDIRLGDKGRIYLCDRRGTALAAHDFEELLALDQPSRRLRLRQLSEVPSASGWASAISKAFDAGTDVGKRTQGGGYVAVSWLQPPLDHFAIVVSAPSQTPFTYASMHSAASAGLGFAVLPYVITMGIAVCLLVRRLLHKYTSCLDEEQEVDHGDVRRSIRGRASVRLSMLGFGGFGGGGGGGRRSSLQRLRGSLLFQLDSVWTRLRHLEMDKLQREQAARGSARGSQASMQSSGGG